MAKRRGRNEGSIYKRRDGRWCAVVDLGWQGRKRRRLAAYCGTQTEAIKALARLKEQRARGVSADSASLTLGDFTNRWLARIEQEVKPRTLQSYRQHLRSYVLPVLS